ncbi:MAG: chromosome segregation protein SMC [Deltaproteobacteria bacterium]|nr:MAG: chromosome segregation protein SMC [Deltaproteobacteria bacterium]
MNKLLRLDIQGFKSIRALNDLSLGPINILIGANGAGKSNFVSFFKMLNQMTDSLGNLQLFVGKYGGGHDLLYEGADVTSRMKGMLRFETDAGLYDYEMELAHAGPDTLIFADEKYRFSGRDSANEASWISPGPGHRESGLLLKESEAAVNLRHLLNRCRAYQFHHTGDTARIRQRWRVEDARELKTDGANLAPFLRRLGCSEPKYYRRIVGTIREIAPFFDDFVLEPDNGYVMLQWKEQNSDLLFGPHQASDGTLRIMALIALLLQPEPGLPSVMILDEPELGLHPYAMTIVAGLIKSVSVHTQIILATQSVTFIDLFGPEDIIVADRPGRESVFRRLDPAELEDWLDEYSLAELWEKNVIGGRP